MNTPFDDCALFNTRVEGQKWRARTCRANERREPAHVAQGFLFAPPSPPASRPLRPPVNPRRRSFDCLCTSATLWQPPLAKHGVGRLAAAPCPPLHSFPFPSLAPPPTRPDAPHAPGTRLSLTRQRRSQSPLRTPLGEAWAVVPVPASAARSIVLTPGLFGACMPSSSSSSSGTVCHGQ